MTKKNDSSCKSLSLKLRNFGGDDKKAIVNNVFEGIKTCQ